MADLVTRLLLNNTQFDNSIRQSSQLIRDFQLISRNIGSSISRFAGALGVAVSATELFTTAINSNATSLNAWNDVLVMTKLNVDNFFTSLINGDWSIWENGIINAISLSKKYALSLRDLDSNLQIGDVHLSQDEKELNRLENIASNPTYSKSEREEAFRLFKKKGKEAVEYIEGLSKETSLNLSDVVKGKNVNTDNVRDMILKYLDTSTSGNKALLKYEGFREELEGAKVLQDRYLHNGSLKAAANLEIIIETLLKEINDIVSLFPDIAEALNLKNAFTLEDINNILEYTDKIIGLEDRLESVKKQVSDLGKDFDKNGYLINSSNAKKPLVKSTSNTDIIPVLIKIPETTLKELEDKRAVIVKQMNTANLDDYVKLKVKLDETDLDIQDFKNGKYGKPRGLKATPVEIKSSLLYSTTSILNTYDYAEALNSLAASLQTVSNLTNEGATAWLTYGANILTTVAAAIPAITALTAAKDMETNANVKNAATGAAASLASIPFVGPILAVAAVASVLAALMAIPKFATGGIVGGNKPFGDMNLARVNSGEMILNNHQQRNLFNLLNNGGSASNGGKVEFKIQGRELVGVLKNYNNKISKVQ